MQSAVVMGVKVDARHSCLSRGRLTVVGLQGRMEESEEVQELYNQFLTHSERERASEGRGPMFYMKPTAEERLYRSEDEIRGVSVWLTDALGAVLVLMLE